MIPLQGGGEGRGNPSQTLSFANKLSHLLHSGPSCAPFFSTGVGEPIDSGCESAPLQSSSEFQGALEGKSRGEFPNNLQCLSRTMFAAWGPLFAGPHVGSGEWVLTRVPGRKTTEAGGGAGRHLWARILSTLAPCEPLPPAYPVSFRQIS